VRGRGETRAVLTTTATVEGLEEDGVMREAGRVVGRTAPYGQTVV